MTRELEDGEIVFGMKVSPLDLIYSDDDPSNIEEQFKVLHLPDGDSDADADADQAIPGAPLARPLDRLHCSSLRLKARTVWCHLVPCNEIWRDTA